MLISPKCLTAGLLLGVLLFSTSTMAQQSSSEVISAERVVSKKDKRHSEKAQKLFEDFGYSAAIKELERKEHHSLDDKIKMANAYRLNHDVNNAARWYDEVVNESSDPSHNLRYAQVLHAIGQEANAKIQYERYLEIVRSDDRWSSIAGTFKANLLATDRFKEHAIILKNESSINSGNLEFSPTIINDGVLFVSTRKPIKYPSINKDPWMGENFMSLYWAPLDEISNELKEPSIFSYDITSKFHEGPASFSDNGSEIFFTRNHLIKGKRKNNKDGIMRLQIYSAQLNNNKWTKPIELPFNTDEYEECHPSVSSDGSTVYFSSNRAGGFGGMDIYKVTRQGDQWSEPINLGADINTTENEVFPLIHNSGVLFFASNGLDGLGGLDLFQSVSIDGKWMEPINLGTPFNSNKDDFGITLNNEMSFGYLTSARDGGMGKDDIYSFEINEAIVSFPATIRFHDSSDNSDLSKVNVSISNIENYPHSTTEDGRIPVNVLSSQFYDIRAQKDGYDPVYIQALGKDILSEPDSQLDIPLNKSKPKCLELTYTIHDKVTNQPVPLVQVSFIDGTNNKRVEKMTDQNGQIHFDCLECSSILRLRAIKDEYVENQFSFSAQNFECSNETPIQELVILEKKKPKPEPAFILYNGIKLVQGEYIVLDRLYYDYNKSNIREDAKDELDRLIKTLFTFPSLVIEIGAHTDVRGTEEYNQLLSEQRANAVLQYLAGQGIPIHQLRSRGYGESSPRNECSDGVQCSEEQHQYNRRTVAQILEIGKKVTIIREDNGPQTIDRKEK